MPETPNADAAPSGLTLGAGAADAAGPPGTIPDVAAAQAEALIDLGRAHEALTLLGPAIAAEPTALRHCAAARALLWLGQWPAAERQAQEAARADPGPRPLLLLAQVAVNQGRHDDARTAVASALERSPDDPEALRIGVLVELAAGFDGRAKTLARRMERAHPALRSTWVTLAKALMETSPAEAETACTQGLQRHPQDSELQTLLSQALAKQGRTRASVEVLQSLAEQQPGGEADRRLDEFRWAPDPYLAGVVMTTPLALLAVRMYSWTVLYATEMLIFWGGAVGFLTSVSIASRAATLPGLRSSLRRHQIRRLATTAVVSAAALAFVLQRATAALNRRGEPTWPVALPAGVAVVVALVVAAITVFGRRRRSAAVPDSSVSGQA